MRIKRTAFVALLIVVAVSAAGCDLDAWGIKRELENVIAAYGHGLLVGDAHQAMRNISYSYYDDNGVDYAERYRQVELALAAGSYLEYDVELHQARAYGDIARARGKLFVAYRLLDTAVVIPAWHTKEWTFRRENGRWRITSEAEY